MHNKKRCRARVGRYRCEEYAKHPGPHIGYNRGKVMLWGYEVGVKG